MSSCQVTFSWDHLSRHRSEKHLLDVPMYGCGVCSYSSSRPDNLQRHKKAKHQLVLDAELDQEEAGGDQELANEVDENQEQDVLHEEENCGDDVKEEKDADAYIERSLRRRIEEQSRNRSIQCNSSKNH